MVRIGSSTTSACTRTDSLPSTRERRDLGVGEPERVEEVAHVLGAGVLAVGHRDLPGRTALELDAEVQLLDEQRAEADEHEDARQDQPAAGVLDELEVRVLVVEVRELVPAGEPRDLAVVGDRREGGQFLRRRAVAAHARTSGTSSPAAIPTLGTRTRFGRRASNDTNGCMNVTVRTRSMSVERPRKNAKPRTEPDAR